MQYLLIAFAYISLFITLFWLQVLLFYRDERGKKLVLPSVSVVVPVYNEEKTLGKTLRSLLAVDYPRDKLEVIVVNDGSTDNTEKVARSFSRVVYIEQKNKGKAAAMNAGLRKATGELFSCLDADSFVKKDALKKNVQHFFDPRVGGVICAIKVYNPRRFIEKLQRFEYIMSVLIRKLMARVHALFITPGVMSVYRTNVLRSLGGFSEGNLTEDFEMALRLHKHHYDVKIETEGVGYTIVPQTWRALFQQRVRWFRGFIYNVWNYRGLFFHKDYGVLGSFQLPIAVLGVAILLITMGLIGLKFLRAFFYRVLDFLNLGWDVFKLIEPPTFRSFLSLDYMLIFPLVVGLGFVLFFLFKAHRESRERFRYPFSFLFYLWYYSIMLALCWTTAIIKETFKTKRQW